MRRTKYVLILILIGIIVFLNLPLPVSRNISSAVRDQFSPFEEGISLVTGKGAELLAFFGRFGRESRENRELTKQVAYLKQQVRRLRFLEKDNEELRRQLSFAQQQKHDLVLCEVVVRGDATGWWKTIRLSKGAKDGIRENMAVITVSGLIGRTMEVSPQNCDVLLITDPNCRVACRVTRTGSFGILKGRGIQSGRAAVLDMLAAARPAEMKYIPREAEIMEGDEVVTSGLGGIFPENFLVGHIRETRVAASGLYREAEVVPAADMDALKYAFVVLN